METPEIRTLVNRNPHVDSAIIDEFDRLQQFTDYSGELRRKGAGYRLSAPFSGLVPWGNTHTAISTVQCGIAGLSFASDRGSQGRLENRHLTA